MKQTGSNSNARAIIDRWLKVYAGHYTGRKPYSPEEQDAVRQALSDCDPASLDRAFLKAFQESLDFCPTIGRVRDFAATITQKDNAPHFPRQRFFPKPHGCDITGRFNIDSVRGYLIQLNNYEGTHVLCQGVMTPVCWWCGDEQKPWVNPVIIKLVEMHPDETKDWNPYHKGTLMCDTCAAMKWPTDFLAQEAEQARPTA